MTWHAIASERGREYRLADRIRALGLIAYVPTETHDRLIKREWVKHTKPALRGYVFVNCEPEDWDVVRGLDGFGRWVTRVAAGVDPTPATLPDKSLQAVFLAEVFGAMDYTKRRKPLRPGQRVRVTGGKFGGYLLRIISVGKHKALAEPEKGFGRMEVRVDQLEAA